MSGYMNKKHSRYPLIAKIGAALQVTEKCYTGTEPWATPALRPRGQGDIFYPPSLSGCKRKSSDARGEPSS